MLPVLLTLFLMDFLDTVGTLVGVGAAGNMLDENGNFPRIQRPMLVDATACVFSALVGTSTSGAYIESATGIKDGARTGPGGGRHGTALPGLPLLRAAGGGPAGSAFAYGPALIVVGILMVRSIQKIDFEDPSELVPAFLTIVMMVFTYNIANGLTAGLLIYPLLKLATGRARQINAGMACLGILCLLYYLSGLVH